MEKKIAAGLSITSNSILILLKFITGHLTGSISIISEAIHSLSDFFCSIITFFAVSRSNEPADKEHPFGHGKYEDMSGFIEGGFITFAGLYIIFKAFLGISAVLRGTPIMTTSLYGIYIMTFAVVVNFFVSNYLNYIAKKTGSVSLHADAEHLRTDIYSSLGVLIGLILIKVTGFEILDPIAAVIVALIIIKTGYSISKKTLNNLLDGSLPPEDIKKIEKILANNTSIKGYKNVKARKAGCYMNVEVTVFFNPDMRISDCHRVCDEIENNLQKELVNINVFIHLEPYMETMEKINSAY